MDKLDSRQLVFLVLDNVWAVDSVLLLIHVRFDDFQHIYLYWYILLQLTAAWYCTGPWSDPDSPSASVPGVLAVACFGCLRRSAHVCVVGAASSGEVANPTSPATATTLLLHL